MRAGEYIATSPHRPVCSPSSRILDLALSRRGMTLNLGTVDILKPWKQRRSIRDRLVKDGIRLDILAAGDIGTFTADERRIRQVLFNLLSNAVGFSPPGQAVKFIAERREGAIVFAVTDQGPGIPAEMTDRIFDWFEANPLGSRHRGAGLGLSIVRSFVELHGGTVKIDSAVGRGTTVICVFPPSGKRPNDSAAYRVTDRRCCRPHRRLPSFSVLLENQRATSRLVIDIANALEPGDFVTLSGDLGAGKTTFTRALIRYLADDQQLEVPSPTFTLLQTYDLPPFPVVHIDLFRLSNPGELTELGSTSARNTGPC